MAGSLLTAANWPIVGQIAWLMGKLMNFIYTFLDKVLFTDTGLVGLSMIIYTVIVYTLMLPMTIKQQRMSKMQAVMNPEIQAIQKKYQNKRDEASMMKQQEEMQQVYDKYGTSMMSGCLPMLIQMPFLFALYPVIISIKNYVPALKTASAAVNRFLTIPDITLSPATMFKNSGDYGIAPFLIIATAILLPVISAATQYLSTRLMQSVSGNQVDKDNPMAGTMKSMNLMMPLMSLFIVFTSPAAIGIYWIVSAVVRCVQQLMVNKHLEKMSVEEIVKKNQEKARKKYEKRSVKREQLNQMAHVNARKISDPKTSTTQMTEAEREKRVEEAKEKARNAKSGSLADKANMVRKFNENK